MSTLKVLEQIGLDRGDPRFGHFFSGVADGQDLLVESLWDAPKALLAAAAQAETGKHILILTGHGQEESKLYHDLSYLASHTVVEFPAWETLPTEDVPPSPDIVGDRYRVLKQITASKQPLLILSNLQACLQRLIPPSAFTDLYLTLATEMEIPFQGLIDQLERMGYRRQNLAADKGEYAIRGGIIDIFPVSMPEPYRLEFWGDQIESIRAYDPVSQRSVDRVDSISVTPGRELELIRDRDDLCTLFDYLGKNTLVVFDDLVSLEDRYVSLLQMHSKPSPTFCSIEELFDSVESLQKLYFAPEELEKLSDVTVRRGDSGSLYAASQGLHTVNFEMFNRGLKAERWNHRFEEVGEYLMQFVEADTDQTSLYEGLSTLPEDVSLTFLCATDSEERYLREQLSERGVQLPSSVSFARGYLSSGYSLPEQRSLVVPLTEITRQYRIRRQKQRSTYHSSPLEMYELHPGDNVVHLSHGIGRFVGTESRQNHEGVQTEFFCIEYAEEAKLFVPLTQSHLISKYVGAQDEKVSLHTIGAGRWKRTRATTEKAIMGYASDLLKLYAKREVKGGHSYPPASGDSIRFGEDFPFVETEDQIKAVEDINFDMLSTKCMDRLVCGDVGYGKTEVAMRAAFRAVVDGGKQVAILVPTTVLAMQHYETFCQRMSNYPITIRHLSRFTSTKETRLTLEGLAAGGIDVVVGTHRIVSKDVAFKNLGLVIIDEEQRFGVRAKEHLKKIKTGVDCLTLSATPIPRTLYMSLLGARDISVIATPPQDRLPIKTIISEADDQIVKQAILRELNRDGQVFFIHNRVNSIYEVGTKLQKLVPQARIVVGHGQMSAEELDTVFHQFKSGEADILVATTIVENGIDIPNANTILIDRADRFGLAELYQLRGRVGRWNRQAYAYFLTPKKRALSEISQKRLQALAEASGYGGGMKIAMRDLEIRGAGDILGTEQSGHVAAVGFHLYCKLLKRTVQALQGQLPSTLVDPKIEVPVDARLPSDYVNAPNLRMDIYQRFGDAIDIGEVDEIWAELKDRFGPPPEAAKWLYYVTRIRVFAARHSISLVKVRKASLLAERKEGKKTVTKEALLPKIRGPADLEGKVIAALKKAFSIKA